VRIYFYVEYVYERKVSCGGYTCYYFHYLYPVEIRGVYRADQYPIGGYIEAYTPPDTAPTYSYVGCGSQSIDFTPTYVSDSSLVSTSVNFSLSLGSIRWSATLTVDFYKAGRSDDRYVTLYVSISAPHGFCYYWWYNNDDKMTYEILFKPYP